MSHEFKNFFPYLHSDTGLGDAINAARNHHRHCTNMRDMRMRELNNAIALSPDSPRISVLREQVEIWEKFLSKADAAVERLRTEFTQRLRRKVGKTNPPRKAR